jgi:hypothetical protein
VALRNSVRRERRQAFSSPISATSRAVMISIWELGALKLGSAEINYAACHDGGQNPFGLSHKVCELVRT